MDAKINRGGSVVSGALLISGTCIGAGILALPLVTGVTGALPATAVTLLCWLVMVATGMLFLEAILWMEDGANVLSIAQRFLGIPGRLVAGGAFLFLYYCLLVAYLAGASAPFHQFVTQQLGLALTFKQSAVLFCSICVALVAFGTRVVDRCNWILMSGLIVSYILMLGIGSSEVDSKNYIHQHWSLWLPTFPILFSAFGYHNVLPTISTYLDRHPSHLKKALLYGTVIPTFAYLLWQWLVIGVLSQEQLTEASKQGVPVTFMLNGQTDQSLFYKVSIFFTFFALVTSLLGVSLSMVDFFADGIHLEKRVGKRRILLSLAVFVPPFLLSFGDPSLFKRALAVAGGFGEGILNGLFPITVVWIGRYKLGLKSKLKLPGGKGILVLIGLFVLSIVLFEIAEVMGWIEV